LKISNIISDTIVSASNITHEVSLLEHLEYSIAISSFLNEAVMV